MVNIPDGCLMLPTYLPIWVRVMEEAGVPPLVISLVINIRTLVRPFLSHPGQLVVPDLVKAE